ncbi:MAG: NfeD family protein [Gemmobacter sp.]
MTAATGRRNSWRMLRLAFFFAAMLTGALALSAQGERGRDAVLLTLADAVSPATADYVVRGIAVAAERDAGLVIIRMDTPGGLETSMNDIVKAILASPVPVAVHVAPSGARAASAGTYILYAAHVAAMAPSTRLGAATPVAIGGGMPFGGSDEDGDRPGETTPETANGAEERPRDPARQRPPNAAAAKAINDAVASIRGLADLRGRDADFAERAVREAATMTAREAAEAGVIDFVARDTAELLALADGRVVEVDGAEVTLATAGLAVVEVEPDWRTRLLAVITNPNVAILLMVVGFYGIVFELFNPGTLIPGTIGGISLLTGLYALSVLPVSYAGVALILLGLALILAEAFSPSFGILGIGGAVAVVLGGTMLIDTDVPGIEVSWAALAAVLVAGAAFSVLVGRMAVASWKARVTTGAEELVGLSAEVRDWRGTRGHVCVHGERWKAEADAPLRPGERVRVTGIEGLTLRVAPGGETLRAAGQPARGDRQEV